MIVENKIVDTFLLITFVTFWLLAFTSKQGRTIFSVPDVFNSKSGSPNKCYLQESDLKLVEIDLSYAPEFSVIHRKYPSLNPGGSHAPEKCKSFQKLAILIPYRNRLKHLKILLYRLHGLLIKQKIDYKIFLIEQADDLNFNRGMLMNVGVIEALKDDPSYNCFIFHDVDLIPEHDLNIYMCDENLRNFAASVNENRYHFTYANYGGGVSGLSKENFFKINGFPNLYWGWGNEDDDFSARTLNFNLKISRPPLYYARYKMIRHVKSSRIVTESKFPSFRGRQMIDGVNSITKESYMVKSIEPSDPSSRKLREEEFLFTRIRVNLNQSQQALPFTSLSILMDEEEEEYKRDESSLPWPPQTKQSSWWYLKFYGWL